MYHTHYRKLRAVELIYFFTVECFLCIFILNGNFSICQFAMVRYCSKYWNVPCCVQPISCKLVCCYKGFTELSRQMREMWHLVILCWRNALSQDKGICPHNENRCIMWKGIRKFCEAEEKWFCEWNLLANTQKPLNPFNL